MALTATSVPLWFQLSLMVECHGRVERALASLEPASDLGGRREMQLYAALGASLIQIKTHLRASPEVRTETMPHSGRP
jgi:hypothetical protein